MTLEEIRKQIATTPSGEMIVADDAVREFLKALDSEIKGDSSYETTSDIRKIKCDIEITYSNRKETFRIVKQQHY